VFLALGLGLAIALATAAGALVAGRELIERVLFADPEAHLASLRAAIGAAETT
jgi:hypothetical protein